MGITKEAEDALIEAIDNIRRLDHNLNIVKKVLENKYKKDIETLAEEADREDQNGNKPKAKIDEE